MIKKKFILRNCFSFIFFLSCILLSSNSQLANEILIYADEITYDKNQNLVGKGNAKILFENQIIILCYICKLYNLNSLILSYFIKYYH